MSEDSFKKDALKKPKIDDAISDAAKSRQAEENLALKDMTVFDDVYTNCTCFNDHIDHVASMRTKAQGYKSNKAFKQAEAKAVSDCPYYTECKDQWMTCVNNWAISIFLDLEIADTLEAKCNGPRDMMCYQRNTTHPQTTVAFIIDEAFLTNTVSSGNMDCWSYAAWCEQDGPDPKCKGMWEHIENFDDLSDEDQEAILEGIYHEKFDVVDQYVEDEEETTDEDEKNGKKDGASSTASTTHKTKKKQIVQPHNQAATYKPSHKKFRGLPKHTPKKGLQKVTLSSTAPPTHPPAEPSTTTPKKQQTSSQSTIQQDAEKAIADDDAQTKQEQKTLDSEHTVGVKNKKQKTSTDTDDDAHHDGDEDGDQSQKTTKEPTKKSSHKKKATHQKPADDEEGDYDDEEGDEHDDEHDGPSRVRMLLEESYKHQTIGASRLRLLLAGAITMSTASTSNILRRATKAVGSLEQAKLGLQTARTELKSAAKNYWDVLQTEEEN